MRDGYRSLEMQAVRVPAFVSFSFPIAVLQFALFVFFLFPGDDDYSRNDEF